jgi:hypothetical protein
VEKGGKLRRSILLHGRHRMRVDVERDLDPFVSQALLHDFDRDAGLQQQRRAGMPQAMKLDSPDSGCLDDPLVFMLPDVIQLERMPLRYPPAAVDAPIHLRTRGE